MKPTKTMTLTILIILLAALFLTACSGTSQISANTSAGVTQTVELPVQSAEKSSYSTETQAIDTNNQTADVTEATESGTIDATSVIQSIEGSMLDVSGMFTDRDLEQTVDLSEATALTVENDSEILITEEGIYVISGDASNCTIIVEADDEAKVQFVLDGVNVINESQPVIYVKSADKVFVTTMDNDNSMEVSDADARDNETNLDAVIFSKSDLVLNGTGTLKVVAGTANGITSKDDLKVTGGTISIDAKEDGLEANDSIRIYDGTITIVSDKDTLHSENEDDLTLGYIYIAGGELTLSAGDDGIRGTSIVQIDGGVINIETCQEGIEGTYVQINGGTITIYGMDDGINAAAKSNYDVVIELNGGTIDITMASGDTDAVDSNGNIYINGGTITIAGGSSFDVNENGLIEFNGGDVMVNGEVMTEIVAQQPRGHRK